MDASPEWLELVSRLKFPERTERRIQELMARNNEGQLLGSEREELASFVELSELIAVVRAEAVQLLGRQP